MIRQLIEQHGGCAAVGAVLLTLGVLAAGALVYRAWIEEAEERCLRCGGRRRARHSLFCSEACYKAWATETRKS